MFINSTKTLGNPELNNAPSTQDEDGEVENIRGDATVDVNAAGLTDGSDDEDDTSPAVHSVTVTHNGAHTDITVRVSHPSGWHNKRLVLTGHLTAKKLAAHIANVGNW